ncbi:MAG: hypothetical protein ABSH09_29315, partial [Bryobacteraceae bacterium]
ARSDAARAALTRYETTILPTYAIKEFRAGALDTYVWFYNLLLQEGTLAKAVARCAAEAAYRPNRLRTSLELQARLLNEVFPGGETQIESGRRMRLYLWRTVYKAWEMRETIATWRTVRLACFPEDKPVENSDKQLVLRPCSCLKKSNCSLVGELRSKPEEIRILLAVVEDAADKRENRTRAKSLRHLLAAGRFGDVMCRGLGDAVFALTAPADTCVVTTNLKDHGPLTAALGKSAERL